MEFLGRIDHQLKIRGYRIEPGEIEKQLLNHDKVKEALVMARQYETGEQYLCAYVVSLSSVDHGFKKYLSERLPDYMVPARFVMLEQMPLTPNGKIDMKALPEPRKAAGAEGFSAPRNAIEKKMAAVWSEILGIAKEKIAINHDFFELGGHSLKAMTLTARLHKELDIKIPLQEIFQAPTIRELAAYAGQAAQRVGETGQYRDIEPVEKCEYYPLSSVQKRLYIFQQVEADSVGYNIPAIMEVEGHIDKDKFEKVFKQLIQRHESLRTSFQTVKGQPVQRIHDEKETPRIENTNTVIEHFIRPFDLSKAPLLRTGLKKLNESRHIFMIDMHHIVTDGVSMGLFFREFLALYLGVDSELPPLRLQYRDFSQWQNRFQTREGENYKKMAAFWLKQMEKKPSALNLPYDYERPPVQNFAGNHLYFDIETDEAALLKQLAVETDATLFMVLLAVSNVWLSKLGGLEDIVLGSPVEGRSHADLRHIIGMFVNTLVLRNYPRHNKRFDEFLKEVRQRTLGAFENQDYLFEDLVKAVNLPPDPGRNSLFDVLFTLQNMDVEPGYIPGLEKEASRDNDKLKMIPYPHRTPVSKFDLMLTAVERADGGIHFIVEYPTKLFKEETVKRFTGYFREIVRAVIKDKSIQLKDITVSHDLLHVASHNPGMELGF